MGLGSFLLRQSVCLVHSLPFSVAFSIRLSGCLVLVSDFGLTGGVGEAGLTLVDQRFDCICA